jgi:hypothetical protein
MTIRILILALVACGTNGTTTLAGSNGFTPTTTLMMQTPPGCAQTGLMTNGNLDAFAAVAADAELSCSGGRILASHALLIQVATPGYFAADPNAANNPIVAGTQFSILDENVSDEDLCGNVENATQPTAIAVFDECPAAGDCTAEMWATSGSVTVTSVSSTDVEGTFDLVLGDEDGPSDGGTLTGTFAASTCAP